MRYPAGFKRCIVPLDTFGGALKGSCWSIFNHLAVWEVLILGKMRIAVYTGYQRMIERNDKLRNTG
jgi:hypothetical protein